MADDIVDITLNNDLVSDPNGNMANINGMIQVDYTDKSYSGDYTVKGATISASGMLSNSGGLTDNGGNYTLTDGSLSVTYSGEQPSNALSESYTVQPIVVNGTTISPSDTYSGTSQSLVSTPVCFVAGTQILTIQGDVAIEALRVGDLVVTTSGAARPVKWLGHRMIDCVRHPHRAALLPVRIAAHAFGPNRPARDLLLSPGHALCFDIMGEAFVPAGSLIDGGAIEQIEMQRVTYWHVELDKHDVILAENMPAESYIDMGNRGFFVENNVIVIEAIPDTKVSHDNFCRPFHSSGPVINAVRARLAARRANGFPKDGAWLNKDIVSRTIAKSA